MISKMVRVDQATVPGQWPIRKLVGCRLEVALARVRNREAMALSARMETGEAVVANSRSTGNKEGCDGSILLHRPIFPLSSSYHLQLRRKHVRLPYLPGTCGCMGGWSPLRGTNACHVAR
jgi:hypothetical protein